ncbi:MAG TPA: glyoxalase/bleomycin resistance/extradiol dioxygenase family protein [Anaeromyxobacter sp.]|nr:glyoxalase/bleomycin resistance/extradiol dioxygenase family protein [Anaeromyxobacter sp.]
MAITQLNPYLSFDGTAEKAIQLYERALGAQVEGGIMRFGEVPGMESAPSDRNRVMHAMLQVGGGVIMVSDSMAGQPVATEGNVEVCLQLDDPADLDQKFEALAAGGKVTMAPHDAFWGARFGALTDAFGVRWMFNCPKKS